MSFKEAGLQAELEKEVKEFEIKEEMQKVRQNELMDKQQLQSFYTLLKVPCN